MGKCVDKRRLLQAIRCCKELIGPDCERCPYQSLKDDCYTCRESMLEDCKSSLIHARMPETLNCEKGLKLVNLCDIQQEPDKDNVMNGVYFAGSRHGRTIELVRQIVHDMIQNTQTITPPLIVCQKCWFVGRAMKTYNEKYTGEELLAGYKARYCPQCGERLDEEDDGRRTDGQDQVGQARGKAEGAVR